MRAAEKLISENGVENVSIREIVAAAGQKNESALQYHFASLTGLIDAILEERAAQIQDKRDALLSATLGDKPEPSLRQLCALMVQPTFDLARSNVDFRRYIKAFGHQLAQTTNASPLHTVSTKGGAGGSSGVQLAHMLRGALPHLDEQDYLRRMDAAVILCSTSMYHQARQKGAFRGQQSELFYQHLLDALYGLLNAPVSAETKAAKRS